MLEGFNKKINEIEMKAASNPAPGSQFEKLEKIDSEIKKLKEQLISEQSIIENNENEGDFQLYLKSYHLEEDLLNKIKEKNLIISDISTGFRIESHKESASIEDIAYLKSLDKGENIFHRIEKLKTEISSLKLEKPDNLIDKDLQRQRIKIINEEIDDLIRQN